jgi:hypothetical protein
LHSAQHKRAQTTAESLTQLKKKAAKAAAGVTAGAARIKSGVLGTCQLVEISFKLLQGEKPGRRKRHWLIRSPSAPGKHLWPAHYLHELFFVGHRAVPHLKKKQK